MVSNYAILKLNHLDCAIEKQICKLGVRLSENCVNYKALMLGMAGSIGRDVMFFILDGEFIPSTSYHHRAVCFLQNFPFKLGDRRAANESIKQSSAMLRLSLGLKEKKREDIGTEL